MRSNASSWISRSRRKLALRGRASVLPKVCAMLARCAPISSGRKRKSRKYLPRLSINRQISQDLPDRDTSVLQSKQLIRTCRSLQGKAARKHPNEYAKARARYPSPEY